MVLLAAILGCGSPGIECEGPSTVVARSGDPRLACGDADHVVDYIERLRASPVPEGDRRLVRGALAERFESDPKGTTESIARIRAEGRRLLGLKGPEATRARSKAVYDAHHGSGPLPGGELERLVRKLVPIWGSSDAAKVSLTEADVEAWIRYASLCREVQGGTPLRISVADRVGVYRAIQERFAEGEPPEQRALASLGAVWLQIRRAWIRADYAEQQAWIGSAPLPGPMTATSSDYARAIVAGDVAGHVRTLTEHFGPFTIASDRPMFTSETPPEDAAPE